MKIECNGDRVSMSKNEYRQVINKQNDYKQQRDSLIKDVEKLREELRMHIQCNDELGRVNKLKDKTISELQVISSNYNYLTNHIKDKAINNPSVSRYIDLVHFIDDLERDTHEG